MSGHKKRKYLVQQIKLLDVQLALVDVPERRHTNSWTAQEWMRARAYTNTDLLGRIATRQRFLKGALK